MSGCEDWRFGDAKIDGWNTKHHQSCAPLELKLWALNMFFKVDIPPESWKVKGKRLNRVKSSYLLIFQGVPIDHKGFLLHTLWELTNHH